MIILLFQFWGWKVDCDRGSVCEEFADTYMVNLLPNGGVVCCVFLGTYINTTGIKSLSFHCLPPLLVCPHLFSYTLGKIKPKECALSHLFRFCWKSILKGCQQPRQKNCDFFIIIIFPFVNFNFDNILTLLSLQNVHTVEWIELLISR